MASPDEIVITGMGVVSPGGQGVEAYRQALLQGRSGIVPINEFKVDDLSVRIAGMVRGLDISGALTQEEFQRTPRATHLATVAAHEAMGADAKEKIQDPTRVGVVVGACSSGMEVLTRELKLMWDKVPLDQMDPEAVPQLFDNNSTSFIAMKYGIQGPALCLATACATSMDCLGIAADLVSSGMVDAALAGGGDAAVTRFSLAAFSNARALSKNNDNPTFASRPFDKERDGFVMGEAAAVFFVEKRSRAEKRGARILARLCGYGATNDAHHLVAPRPDGAGLAAAMKMGLERSGIRPQDVDYVSAHGTSTEQGDTAEAVALRTVFGDHTDKLQVGATKSMFGHSIGGAGGISSVAAVLAVSEGILAPSLGFRTADPECNIPVFSETRTGQAVRHAIANAAGFGGENSTLVFGAP